MGRKGVTIQIHFRYFILVSFHFSQFHRPFLLVLEAFSPCIMPISFLVCLSLKFIITTIRSYFSLCVLLTFSHEAALLWAGLPYLFFYTSHVT